jgi:hypothetical protein
MPIRKTESRLPAGFQPADLGEAIESPDGKISLLSFFTSPLTPKLKNTYVVIVKDAALASAVQSFEWDIDEDGTLPVSEITTIGEIDYQTRNIGNITVSVKILDNTDTTIATLLLIQEIRQLNPTVENQIENATTNEGAGAANPEIVRELINGFRPYYQNLQLQTPEPDDAFQRFIAGIIFRGRLKNSIEKQKENFNRLAESIDETIEAFPVYAAQGIGVCNIRLALLAMNYPASSPLLAWTELPEPADKNAFADEQLRQKFTEISTNDKIDLLNLARFPKTNINLCAKIIEALRNKYFGGASFNDVMTGMNGTRGHWILKHYLNGPLAK